MPDLVEQCLHNFYPLKHFRYSRFMYDIFIFWIHKNGSLITTSTTSTPHQLQPRHIYRTSPLPWNHYKTKHINTTLHRNLQIAMYTYMLLAAFHPKNPLSITKFDVTTAFILTQLTRDVQLIVLNQACRRLNYSSNKVNQQIIRAKLISRNDLLKDRPQEQNNRAPIVTIYIYPT